MTAPHAAEQLRRLTYLMLFRVVVTTLLLGAVVAVQLAAPASPGAPLGDAAAIAPAVFALIATIYALTLLWAALLRRARADAARLARLARIQIGCDLAATTLLVHLTGGAESGLVFLYLLVLVGGSTVLAGRRAPWGIAGAAALSYLGIGLAGRVGLLPPWPGAAHLEGPVGGVLRALAVNLVALSATAALASRLSVELLRAGERLVAQGALLQDFAALHLDVVRSLTSGLITLSGTGMVQSINPAGAELLGTTVASATGRPIDVVWPGLAGVLGDEPSVRVRRAEVAFAGPDGERRVLGLSASPLYGAAAGAAGRVVSFQDLTELRRAQAQVERSERLAAIGRLAAGVAHEIRNPLAAISGSIELLRGSAPSADGEGRELWEIVVREIDRLNALITDLLEFARPPAPERAPLEVGSAVGEMLKVFENDKRLAGARAVLEAAPPLWVDADPAQLRQVVWNLLRNAAEATSDGTPIAVSAAADARPDGEWVRLSVRDHGAGIPEQHRARLFEPFFSTKRGGTGLGLATVHRIVEEHGGRMEIGNADGGGAIATVWLRRRPPPS